MDDFQVIKMSYNRDMEKLNTKFIQNFYKWKNLV